jgi:hypothetical protein
VNRFADRRSFVISVDLNSANFISLSEDIVVDSFMQQNKLYLTLQTFNLDKRTLGGAYDFKIVDALTFKPLENVKGNFLLSSTEKG